MSVPIPIIATSNHATHLPNLQYYFAITHDKKHYTTLEKADLARCRRTLIHSTITSNLTIMRINIVYNSKSNVQSFCNFRFMENAIKRIEVKPSTILVYRNSLLSLECGLHQRMITGCDFCIMNIPCHCSITTKNHYLQPRLATCSNETRNVTTEHPFNLALLQEFFDSSMNIFMRTLHFNVLLTYLHLHSIFTNMKCIKS